MRRFLCIIILGLAAVAPAARADYGVLGTANGYGEFILGNSDRGSVDGQGKIAVMGNANFNGFSVASKQATGAVVNLVVGGNLTETGASSNGSVVVGGNTIYQTPTISGNFSGNGSVVFDPNFSGGTISGNVKYGTTFKNGGVNNSGVTISGTTTQGITPLPVNFAAEQTFLNNLSAAQYKVGDPSLVQYPSNTGPPATPPAFYSQYGTINVNETVKGDYFFNISGDLFASAGGSGLKINAPVGSTIVFNVTGSGFTMPNTGTNLSGGFTVDHLLYNFLNATSITLAGSTEGTFLAPKAIIHANSGGFNGNLIAAGLTGTSAGQSTTLETHIFDQGTGPNTLFSGNLRLAVVPEPGSIALLGIGGLGAVWAMRRKRAA